MSLVVEIVVSVLVVVGAAFVLAAAVAMFRVRDALSRVNVLGPATALGLPLIVLGAWIHDVAAHGFGWGRALATLVTVASLLVVSSVASNVLARAAYASGAPVDERTDPQDLADEPP